MENGWQTYHIHCNECYKRHCNEPVGCVMTACGRGCNSILHSCKLEDHNLICPRVKVACLNALYGCPCVIERDKMSDHLLKCPAALVCTQGWSRFPSRSTTRYPPYNKDTLDWSLAMRDEMQLNSRGSCGSSVKRFPSLVPDFDPDVRWDELVMPVGEEDGGEEGDEGEERGNVDEVVVAPPDEFSVCEEECEGDEENAVGDDADVVEQTECVDVRHMKVDLAVTRVPLYIPTRHTLHQFSCRQCFRRDEIHSHHDNIHNNIICHLGVWMDIRCPLHLYGCSFTRANLIPFTSHGGRIVFNKEFSSFALRTLSSVEVGALSDMDLLSSLPVEIVLVIYDYLDSFSLMSVASTCHRLRDVSCKILTQRGVVEIVWQKDESKGKWQDHEKSVLTFQHWYFSTSLSQIQWTLSDEELICQHLLNCEYHKQQISERDMDERLHLPGLNRRSFEQLAATLQTQNVRES